MQARRSRGPAVVGPTPPRLRAWLPAAVLALAALACGQGASLTTDTRSSQFATDAEKIAFLARYLKLPSPVEAAEFHVRYQDNSRGLVPGPSDWDVRAVVRVQPAETARWAEGLRRLPVGAAPSVDLSWGHALLPDEARWRLASSPALYTRDEGAVVVAVFEAEGIVMKRVVGR